MKFFSRCRILAGVLSVLCGVVGLVIGFQFIPLLIDGHFTLCDSGTNRELMIMLFLILLFAILLLAVIALRCIIRDAQEDLEAVTNYRKNRESDRG